LDPANESQRVSRRQFAGAVSAAAASVVGVARGEAALPSIASDRQPSDPDQRAQSVDRAIDRLWSGGQSEDGAFGVRADIGVTALATIATLRHGRSIHDSSVARSLRHITQLVQPDGGIYSAGGMLANYETCLAIMCLKEANVDECYSPLLRAAEDYIRGQQWDETKIKDESDAAYGGAGYGKRKRPDLSNTAFFVEALTACGSAADDSAMAKALVFVSRCQNLQSAHNTTPFASLNPDGGFYYTCAAGGGSPAGVTDAGGLRSYASMTCSGLKSMLHAGLGPDDPRIGAAVGWLRNNYDLRSNAGLGDAGLYYYYHVLAQTMQALGCWSFEDSRGVSHDWRSELAGELFRRQQPDGSWVNENNRWMEGDRNLVTAYALLALSYC
jgi:squalene-hopene/tetraprenyl-beta-curcumene cyclase